MSKHRVVPVIALLFIATGLPACQPQTDQSVATNDAAPESVSGKPTPIPTGGGNTSPGKPSAPIDMRYEVMGTPVVGSPIAVNIDFSADESHGPVQVRYSIADGSAVTFQDGQVERLELDGRRANNRQQLMVIPQREGRIYVNVSAEVQTANGMMIKSMAIPIQVGNAPNAPTTNGEIKEGPEGETVISLPASEPR